MVEQQLNRGTFIQYMVRAGFPVEVARLIEWFRRVSQIRIECFMRGLPPLSITGFPSIDFFHDTPETRGHRETIRIIGSCIGDLREYRPSWGYLQ